MSYDMRFPMHHKWNRLVIEAMIPGDKPAGYCRTPEFIEMPADEWHLLYNEVLESLKERDLPMRCVDLGDRRNFLFIGVPMVVK